MIKLDIGLKISRVRLPYLSFLSLFRENCAGRRAARRLSVTFSPDNMEVAVPGKSVKLFSQMIKCLGKVGEELYLEAYPDKVRIGCIATSNLSQNSNVKFVYIIAQVLLKTLNANRSAYFSFCLVPSFFESYNLANTRCTCKVLLKVCSITLILRLLSHSPSII